jgi:hypothetical protein
VLFNLRAICSLVAQIIAFLDKVIPNYKSRCNTSDRKINAKILLEDYRKNAVSLILSPYLINIRKISPDQSNQSLIEWLERCNAVRRLDFRPRQRIKDSIKTAMKVKIPPLRLETLSSRNPERHRMIVLSIIE